MMYALLPFSNVPLRAIDGEIGSVLDVYFDDQNWSVRYLLVHLGHLLDSREVLIPHRMLEPPTGEQQPVPVSLTRAQIETAPPSEQHVPVSHQHELVTLKHFGWPVNWPQGADQTRFVEALRNLQPHDEHLRSVNEIRGYTIRASDGDPGRVYDVVVDDHWDIRYLIADLEYGKPGAKTLIEPRLVENIDWADSLLRVSLTRDQVCNSPEFITAADIDATQPEEHPEARATPDSAASHEP